MGHGSQQPRALDLEMLESPGMVKPKPAVLLAPSVKEPVLSLPKDPLCDTELPAHLDDVCPWDRATSASRSFLMISSGVCRFFRMFPPSRS